MGSALTALERAERFCDRFGPAIPVLQAPMAGACPPGLAIAVVRAGGMGAAGIVQDTPERILAWAAQVRAATPGPFQLNTWIPDPSTDDARREAAARRFLAALAGDAALTAPDADPEPGPRPGPAGPGAPDFAEQCEAMLAARPSAVSSVMGLFPAEYVRRVTAAGIAWFATVTTVAEGLAAQEAGASAVVAQGIEAGGHRGTFDPAVAERVGVGLFALVPRLADRLEIPVVAAGGIADGRGAAAALLLGASAVQVGTALLRSPEAGADPAWAGELSGLEPETPCLTSAYSGRPGRAVPTAFVRAWQGADAPPPAPYPAQRRLVAKRRRDGAPGVDAVNHWAGQSAALARRAPAGDVVRDLWTEARSLLRPGA